MNVSQIYYDLNDRIELLHILNKKGKINNFNTKWRHKEGHVIDVSMNVVQVKYSGEDA